jgi:hypothetical protein
MPKHTLFSPRAHGKVEEGSNGVAEAEGLLWFYQI